MKFNFTLLCIITIVMSTVINTSATHLQSHLLFTARMNGSQEVPAVTTAASGVAGFSLNPTRDTLCINVSLQGLSGDVTGIHIHEGLAGTNGDVIMDLTPFISGNRLSTSLTGSALTPEMIAKMLAGSFYLNAHTDQNPNGEIRGQIILETDASYIAKLDGTQEVPQVETDAKGLALFTLSKDLTSLKVKVLVRQLSGAITGAHLHVGAAGTSGDVVSDLTDFLVGNYIEGEVDPTSFLSDLMAGNVYVNVHTDDNPNGEIRGQLSLNKNLAFDSKLNGAQEVPAVTTDALGLFTARISYTLDTLYYYGLVRDLSGDIGGAHFHEGAVG
ncbi:MAG: CHRD domain-containing protein, partial [Chitinophagales bacterium]